MVITDFVSFRRRKEGERGIGPEYVCTSTSTYKYCKKEPFLCRVFKPRHIYYTDNNSEHILIALSIEQPEIPTWNDYNFPKAASRAGSPML